MIERYQTKAMTDIWSEENKYKTWLKVESIVLDILTEDFYGILNQEDNKPIQHSLDSLALDINKIKERELKTRHDVVAFLEVIEEEFKKVEPQRARFIHFGMTSSDLLDTSLSFLLKASCEVIQDASLTLRKELLKQIETHKDTLRVGRTHGQNAEWTTVGWYLAGIYEQIRNIEQELETFSKYALRAKISGPVGNYTTINKSIEDEVNEWLSLTPITNPTFDTQIICRDLHAQFAMLVSRMACAIERFATEIRHSQRTEISELAEGFAPGQKGSSAMPHKQNPILCENLCGLARYIRTTIPGFLENINSWGERDISHSSFERIALADICQCIHFMLLRATEVVTNLVVNEPNCNDPRFEKMNSSHQLLTLIQMEFDRKEAHEIVQSGKAHECISEKMKTPLERCSDAISILTAFVEKQKYMIARKEKKD